jgi:hypothetical protein
MGGSHFSYITKLKGKKTREKKRKEKTRTSIRTEM